MTGEGRIQGNISSTCLENTEQTHESINRALDTETHREICADP
jgi:hypothetical protein